MAVVDNAGGMTADAAGIHMNSKKIDVMTPGAATGEAVAYEQLIALLGIINGTVTGAAALAAITPSALDLAQKAVRYQTDSGQLWIPNSTTQGDFRPLIRTNPAYEYRYGSRFDGATGALTATPNADGCVVSTSGGGTATITALNDATHFGSCVLSTSTTTTGGGGVFFGGAGHSPRLSTAARVVYDTWVNIPTNSDGTQTFALIAGWVDTATNPPTNGVWFGADANANANFTINAKTGGSATGPTSSGIAITAGQDYHLQIIKIGGADSAVFLIDGVVVGTISSNIPVGTNILTFCGVKKSAGTTARTATAYWLYTDLFLKVAA